MVVCCGLLERRLDRQGHGGPDKLVKRAGSVLGRSLDPLGIVLEICMWNKVAAS